MGRLRGRLQVYLLLILCLPITSTRAAQRLFQTDPEYLIDSWETEDGLPENSATSMAQTPDGYLWFGTFDKGLVRFDGVKFTIFNPRNTPQLPSAGIVNIHADQRGWLWVSTYDGLVARVGSEWRAFGKEQGWPGDFARTFAERRNGDLLITTFNGEVREFARGSLAPLPEPPGAKGKGYFGLVDGLDQWRVVQKGFVGRWDGQRWNRSIPETETANVGPVFVCGAAARDGGWWLLLDKELRKYRGDAEVRRIQLPERRGFPWSLFEDSSTNIWICTQDRGICKVAPDGRMRHWNKDHGLLASGTRFAFEDREQNVWVGTSGGGLLRFKPRRFLNFGLESGLTERVVRSVATHPDGSVLIGTYGAGMFRVEPTGLTPVAKTVGVNLGFLHCVLADSNSRIWAGTFEYGLSLSGSDGFNRVPKEEFPYPSVFSLFEDSRGRIWAGGTEGACVFDAGKSIRYGSDHGLPKTSVRCFGEDSTGQLWLSNWKGLFRLENDRWVELRDKTNGSITEVACFKSGPDATLWMGTMNDGLLRRKDGRLARIRAENGLPVASIYSILEDDAHWFWIGTGRGVLRVHRKELEEVAEGLTERLNYQLFDLSDGLPSIECTSGVQPTSARDTRGRMWFATSKGVAMVDPAGFRPNTNPPPVRIESLVYHTLQRSKARSQPDPTTLRFESPHLERVIMPPGSRLIEVHFAALSFYAPEKVRFQVRLEGLDTDWHRPVNQQLALFHDLPPGAYTFRVRAANNDGVWTEADANLAFTVLPFFWQTTWFGALCAAIMAGALLLWYRGKMARVEARRLAQEGFTRQLITAQEAERSRLARELHDDITQRVARLAIDTGYAERRENAPEMAETMRAVRENLVQLSDDIHALSYRLHPAVLQDLGLAAALKCECEEFSKKTSIPAKAKVADLPPTIPEDAALCLFRIAQEALRNVGRHSQSKTAEVSLRPFDRGLQLEIADTGVGFDTRQQDRASLGLASMRERVRLLGGELDIDSAPGRGTTVLAWVPLKL